MRRSSSLFISILAGFAAAACDAAPPADNSPSETAADAPAAPTSAEPAVAEPPVPVPPPPRYVGRWAASADLCTDGWWRFWNDELLTKGETRCDILPPDAESGDEARRMVCQAEGTWSREAWTFTYPAEDSMTVQRDAAAPVTLTRC